MFNRHRLRPPLRDYLYISVRKVERLSGRLSGRSLRRLRALNLKAGPVGIGFTLTDAPPRSIISVTESVDSLIRSEYAVHNVSDIGLRTGHYVGAEQFDMAYGVQAAVKGVPDDAAVFVGERDGIAVLLSGSAEYMLDRNIKTIDVGTGMSFPGAVHALLAGVVEGQDPSPKEPQSSTEKASWMELGYPISQLKQQFSISGLQPLSFLARIFNVCNIEDTELNGPHRYVIGSPVWVANDVPA